MDIPIENIFLDLSLTSKQSLLEYVSRKAGELGYTNEPEKLLKDFWHREEESCPAGLAHTPMAAKALEKAGKAIGFNVKIEQQGSMGQVNVITQEEADRADFELIASDQKIEHMERFKGKPVMRVDITTCIKAPEAVLKKCAKAVKQ